MEGVDHLGKDQRQRQHRTGQGWEWGCRDRAFNRDLGTTNVLAHHNFVDAPHHSTSHSER